jgi:GTP-binding protein EngB required for normal cell division
MDSLKVNLPPRTSVKDDVAKANKNELLDVLSEVKTRVQDKLGIVDFPMPQFILIGSQSVGKSRLVESFAGEQFNFISGTLGSRRPTVLEFRNVATATESKWSVLDAQTNQWQHHPTQQVMEIVGEAHNRLGNSVSAEAIHVRVESNQCVDMQIVDLPGYRGFAQNDSGRLLAQQIEQLNMSFLSDQRNVILCVEEAGDAANLSSLRRVADCDPEYRRTILVRNKLDKYYDDLSSDNVNKWLEGYGDLPRDLTKFAMTLPHWHEGAPPPAKLSEIRTEMDRKDLNKIAQLGANKKFLGMVGYGNFAAYMEKRTERMFVEAIGPVLTKLRDLEQSMDQREHELKDELEHSDPQQMLATVRACGMSFSTCLTHVMEGFIRSDINRMNLEDELREFHRYHQQMGDTDSFLALPSEDFGSLDDYIEYLKSHIRVPAFEVAINGGAQFRRLMFEVETFLRFSEIGIETKKRDVLQSFGISMSSVTWREVVVKLLNHDAHLPLQKRIQYVGMRVKWFFEQQKAPIVQFMKSLKGSPDEKIYSVLYSKHAKMIEENATIRKLVFDTYDRVVERQLNQFVELFRSTLHATFSNPWVFLKKTTARLDDDEYASECLLPSLDDTKARIPQEIQGRTGIERTVTKWLYDIPTEPHRIDEAVDQVQLLVLKVYSHIRSQVCDQVELFAESFFKLPLMRRLEEDMIKVELSTVDKEGYRHRREKLSREGAANQQALKEVQECLKVLSTFALKHASA